MLSEDLKEQTLARHQQLEKILVGKIRAVSSLADHIQLLQLFYSYFGGLEEKIKKFIGDEQLTDHDRRRKTDALADDIKALGAQPIAKAQGEDLPLIDNTAKAFGALYVIEGSTLGGSIISKMISGKTGSQKGLSFFNGYGDTGMQMWGIFKAVLNKRPAEEKTDTVKTANDTFLGFGNWIDKMDKIPLL